MNGSTDISSSTLFVNFGGIESSIFAIGAFDGNDEWKLKKMTINYEKTTPVPLPASALVLGAAFGGFGFCARRRSAA